MRIEKLSEQAYAKMPDKIESEILRTINKYMIAIINGEAGSGTVLDRQSIIRDILTRLYPTITRISEDISRREIELAIENLLSTLNLNNILDGNGLQYVTMQRMIGEEDSKRFIMFPFDMPMDINNGDIEVNVNGMDQLTDLHYKYIYDTANSHLVLGIDFVGNILEVSDIVLIRCKTSRDSYIDERMILNTDDKRQIVLPNNSPVDINRGELHISVNGMDQILNFNFRVVTDPIISSKVLAIDFMEELLTIGDIISVRWGRVSRSNFTRLTI